MISAFLLFLFFRLSPTDSIEFVYPVEVISKGAELFSNGSYEEAATHYLKISENDTSYSQAQAALMNVYNALNQYDKSIEIGLKFKEQNTKERKEFYINLGNAYLDSKNHEKSREIYEEGLHYFPYGHVLIYNLGLSHYRMGNHREALACFQRSAKINPYYANNHIMLAYLSVIQGHTTKAMLSYLTYLAINPDRNSTLVYLERLASESVREEGSIPEFSDNNYFSYYDEVIRSKAALDERFKTTVAFNASVVKQSELLFSKLLYDQAVDDFWMQFYVPLFSQLYKRNLHTAYIYFILKSSNNENVTSWLEKHEKEKSDWIEAANSAFSFNRSTIETELMGKKGNYSFWYYGNNNLSAIGNEKADETRVGPWAFYYQNSQLSAFGNYNQAGEKTGEWLYYHENGQLSRKEVYDENGHYTQPAVYYHDNGALSIVAKYNENDALDGPLEYYYACGQLKEVAPFINGSKTGSGHHYYESGDLKIDYSITEGELDGPYKQYFLNGAVQRTYAITKGLTQGPYASYYDNGQVDEQGQYLDDNLHDKWMGYHPNGKLKYSGAFEADNRFGKWEYFHANGNISEVIHYNEAGEKHGDYSTYTEDGALHHVFTYQNDKIVAMVYYNSDSTIIHQAQDVAGNMDYKTYFASGELLGAGTLKEGKLNGPFSMYFLNGTVKQKVNMVDNLYDGIFEEYYSSGELNIKCNFKDGLKNGRYQKFYKNGQVSEDGWYIDNELEQYSRTYHPDGSLDEETYYISGIQHGWNQYFAPGNKLHKSFRYDKGMLTELKQYDSLGNVYHHLPIPHGNGLQTRITVAGDTIYKANMRCGNFDDDVYGYHGNGILESIDPVIHGQVDGPYEARRSDGSIRVRGTYKNGIQDGLWQWYHSNGKVSSERTYVHGKIEGLSVLYHYNGNVESKCTYSDGEVNGPCVYFDQHNNWQLTKIYKKGIGHMAFVDPKSGDTTVFVNKGANTLTSHFANGKVAVIQNYKDGKYHGQNSWYNQDGVLIEQNDYNRGDSHGSSILFFSNGKVYVTTSYHYDMKHGLEIEYYENGRKKRETPYVNDNVNGYEILYNPDGSIKSKTLYWNDDPY